MKSSDHWYISMWGAIIISMLSPNSLISEMSLVAVAIAAAAFLLTREMKPYQCILDKVREQFIPGTLMTEKDLEDFR